MQNKPNPSYYQLVFDVITMIPKGRVTSYGAIADFLSLGSARMVGWALRQLKYSERMEVPAHRVVNSQGQLSGRNAFSSPTRMADLLNSEGINIKNDRVQGFKQHFWHPSEMELDIE